MYSLDAANRFVEEVFLPFWNERFSVRAAEPGDAHRPLAEGCNLLRLFAETDERVIRADFTSRYRNVHYQIEKQEAEDRMPKSRITIERRLDGTPHFRWGKRYLNPTALPAAPTPCGASRLERVAEPRPAAAPRPFARTATSSTATWTPGQRREDISIARYQVTSLLLCYHVHDG